jgi:hypothetical protein
MPLRVVPRLELGSLENLFVSSEAGCQHTIVILIPQTKKKRAFVAKQVSTRPRSPTGWPMPVEEERSGLHDPLHRPPTWIPMPEEWISQEEVPQHYKK